MSQVDTKTRLLDAAERLFSRQGFANTSMRAITSEASANLAAANYHFGSKEALLNAVLERRFLPLNQQRLQRLEQVLADARTRGKAPATEALLRAFIEPTLSFRRCGEGAEDFVSLVGRSLISADPLVRERVISLVQPVFKTLHGALCLALPQLPPEQIFTRLFFIMGAMGHCLCFKGVTQIFESCPASDSEDDEFMTNSLINFVTAGLEAPC